MGVYYDIWVQCGSELKEAMLGDGSLSSIASDMDELHEKALADQHSVQPLATVEEDMTHLQTVQLMADLLYETDADVAVVSDGIFVGNVANTTGVSGRLFAGEIYRESSYNINIPGALNKNLMRLTLTGKELFALLEGGHSVTEGSETAVFDYYWSGMDVEMKDGHIVSAVLRNGTPVEEIGTYQVVISMGRLRLGGLPQRRRYRHNCFGCIPQCHGGKKPYCPRQALQMNWIKQSGGKRSSTVSVL